MWSRNYLYPQFSNEKIGAQGPTASKGPSQDGCPDRLAPKCTQVAPFLFWLLLRITLWQERGHFRTKAGRSLPDWRWVRRGVLWTGSPPRQGGRELSTQWPERECVLSERSCLSKGPEHAQGEVRDSSRLGPSICLKGRGPVHGLGFSRCVQAVCAECQPAGRGYVCLCCAVHMNVKWALSSLREAWEQLLSRGLGSQKAR